MTLRVAIADDSALLRRSIASLLDAEGLDVVGEAADASQLLEMVEYERPDVAIIDIRMPPTYTVEGVRAAAELRETHPQMGVLLLSQYIEVEHVTALLGRSAKGFGYLLKERVSDIDEFIDALRRVAAGGSAIDPGLVSLLVSPPHRRPPLLDSLTDREKEILELMASGKSNRAIAAAVFMSARTVEAHIHEIFHKLQLEPAPENHRRVLAVLAHLQVGDPPTGD